MNKLKILFGGLLMTMISGGNQSCTPVIEPYQVYNVTFENRSNETLYFGAYPYDQITPAMLFDYESRRVVPHLLFKDEIYDLLSVSTGKGGTGGNLHLLIYKQSTLDKYTTEELIENDIYDKRYDLTLDDLKAMDFKIVYTGD